ncbi:OsmC family protein [Iodidimonas sp. SYSU 1G8]|uniref:OsmC family protein n=1 Tax=Iodidimonas sp. SYSU 1G8 TaxID=3133967 RepID=UPI0031FF089C
MKARIKWIEDRNFLGQSDTGHAVVMGSMGGKTGVAIAPTPMEMILMGLGGCTSYDVVHILERGRESIIDCAVEIEAERAAEDPKIFTRIHLHFLLTGKALNPAKVERAIALSAEKYCSASAMLAKAADITHDFEIVEG